MNYLIEVKGANVSREIVGSLKDALSVAAGCLEDGYQVSISPTPLRATARNSAACQAFIQVGQMDMFDRPVLRLVS